MTNVEPIITSDFIGVSYFGDFKLLFFSDISCSDFITINGDTDFEDFNERSNPKCDPPIGRILLIDDQHRLTYYKLDNTSD